MKKTEDRYLISEDALGLIVDIIRTTAETIDRLAEQIKLESKEREILDQLLKPRKGRAKMPPKQEVDWLNELF